MGKTGLGERWPLWTVTWSHKIHAFLDTKHLHSARVADAGSFRGGWAVEWVNVRVYLRVFKCIGIRQFFSPIRLYLITFNHVLTKPRWARAQFRIYQRVLYVSQNKQTFSLKQYWIFRLCNKICNVRITYTEARSCNHCCSGKAVSVVWWSVVKFSEVSQCNDGTSNKVSNIIRRHIDYHILSYSLGSFFINILLYSCLIL